MRTIWKQELEIQDLQNVTAPRGATLLAMRNQRERPTIWFLCDPKEPMVKLGRLRLIGTGHETAMLDEPGWTYLGTDLFDGGDLVLHAFFFPGDMPQ